MTPAEILTKAADLVEAAPKLAKGVYSAYDIELDEQGHESGLHVRWDETEKNRECFCTVGAIHRALCTSWAGGLSLQSEKDDALRALHRVLGFGDLTLSEIEGQVYRWNDERERTKDEVVQALRAAAEVASVIS